MEVRAKATYLGISPQKMRLVAGGLRGLSVRDALEKLNFYPQKGSLFLKKLIKQAVANAISNFKLSEALLTIAKIEIGEGPRLKRQDTSHGARFDRGIIQKRMSHAFIVLESKESGQEKTSVVKKTKRVSRKVTEDEHGTKS